MSRLLLTVFLVFSIVSSSQAQELSKAAAIDVLLAHSKMGEQLGSMAEGFERNVRQAGLGMDSTQQRLLVAAGAAAFDSTALADHLADYFADHYEEVPATEAARWLRSDLVRRIDSLSRSDVRLEELQQYAGRLQTSPPEQARVQVIQRMSRAQHATDFYVDTILGLYRAAVDAAEAIDGSVEGRALPDAMQLRQGAQSMALISFLYIYEDVPQEMLERYVTFFESEAGQWYVTTYSAAVNHAIEQASAALQDELQAAN